MRMSDPTLATGNELNREDSNREQAWLKRAWDGIASYPGPLRRRKGLVHTVCTCVIFPVKAGIRIFVRLSLRKCEP